MFKKDEKTSPKRETSPVEDGQMEARRQSENSDKWILRMLVLAALVCGWMCFKGALGIFSGHPFTALPFAVVVQGVILLALWQMAYRPLGQKVVLAGVWFVAALFSTGAAFVYADQNNWESVVIDSRKEANEYFSRLNAKYGELAASVDALETKVEVEASDRGCGPKCRALKNEAGVARGKLQAAATAHQATLDGAKQLNALDSSKATLQDVGTIVNQVRAAAGDLGAGVELPVVPDTLNFFERVSYVYGVIFGTIEGKEGERFKFALTLGLASLVEVLGLLLSMIHILNHLPHDSRPFPQRFAHRLGVVRNLLRNLGRNSEGYGEVDQAAVTADLRKLGAQPAGTPPTEADRKTGVDQPATASLERDWLRAITAQARIEKKSARDLIVELMPGSPAALSAAKGAAAFFNPKAFDEKPALGVVAVDTGVIRVDGDGTHCGPKWVDWQKFLIRKLASARPQSKSKAGALLRAVGG